VDESNLIRLVEGYLCAKSSRPVALTVSGECDAETDMTFAVRGLCKR
jgi:hypothetical protein